MKHERIKSPDRESTKQTTESQKSKPMTATYPDMYGNPMTFDISPEAFERFGFKYNDRVKTPNGSATVIGVFGGDLWFQVDGEKGPTYWGDTHKERFKRLGFELIK